LGVGVGKIQTNGNNMKFLAGAINGRKISARRWLKIEKIKVVL
jgi:hypothetical protein